MVSNKFENDSQIKGFVSKAVDAILLDRSAAIHHGLSLGYEGTIYAPTEGASFAIRFEKTDGVDLQIPVGDLAHMVGETGYRDPEHFYPGDPFHGTGYAGFGKDGIVPEYVATPGSRIPAGSEIW